MQGIYKITNKINCKVYIGSSTNIEERIMKHKSDLLQNKHSSYKMQLDFNKYTQSAFTYKILEIVNDNSLLKEREEYYINLFDSVNIGYNIIYAKNAEIDYNHRFDDLVLKYSKIKETFKVPIKFDPIYKSKNLKYLKRQVFIYEFLFVLNSVVDNFFYPKTIGKIIDGSLNSFVRIDGLHLLSSITISINYVLKEKNWKQTICFELKDVDDLMKKGNLDLEIATLKIINTGKFLRSW